MAINTRKRNVQLSRLQGAVNLWGPETPDETPEVTLILNEAGHSESFRARVLDVAVPYNDRDGAPLLIVQQGTPVPVFIPANRIVSISDGERIVS